MNKIDTALNAVIAEYKGYKHFVTEDDILDVVIYHGYDVEDLKTLTNYLMTEFKYKKCIYNTDDVDEFGDGHIYTPSPNQECNCYEEWAYVPTTAETGALPVMTQSMIEDLMK